MESSLNLHMDLWDELKLSRLLKQALDEFDYYGVSTVGKTEWESMVQIADQEASPWKEVLEELTPWVEECFQEYDCFIILGI